MVKPITIIAIRLRHDYEEKLTCSFFARVEWRRMEEARAIRRIVGSWSYRSRIAIVITRAVERLIILIALIARLIISIARSRVN